MLANARNIRGSERLEVSSEKYSLLQLFVESPWEKNEIIKLRDWLYSRDIDVQREDWYSSFSWKYKTKTMYSTDPDPFEVRITSELKNVLPLLFKCNDDVSFTNENGQTILHVYLENSESDYRGIRSVYQVLKIVKSLIEKGASVDAVDKQGITPLRIVAENKKPEVLALMLDFSSDIDACDEKGNTLLHIVIEEINKKGDFHEHYDVNLDIVRLLLTKGANPNGKNTEGLTPVQLAVCYFRDILLEILKRNGADFSVRTENNENLLLLALERSIILHNTSAIVKIIDFLVDQGCDVNARNNDGYSPLHYAAFFDRGVERLIELGADVNCQLKVDGATPLHLAVSGACSRKSFEVLFHAGAFSDGVDFRGQTALDKTLLQDDFSNEWPILDFGGDINNRKTIDLWRRCGEETQLKVICHAVRLRTVGFAVDEVYKPYLDIEEVCLEKRKICSKEVKKMKKYMIAKEVSIYQFLHMHWRHRLAYLEYLPRDLERKLPNYASFVLTACNEAVQRNQLVEPAKVVLYQLTETNLPDVCLERIFYFLNNWHLKILIGAGETTTEK